MNRGAPMHRSGGAGRKAALLLLAVLLTPTMTVPAFAQRADEEEVLATVQRLFDAMAARDPVAAGAVLLPEGQLVAVPEGEPGPPVVTSHREFLERLGAGEEPWVERMWEARARVHGPIAVVWTPYDFHRGEVFSHCGVDALTLVWTDEGWKISGGVYTVQQEACPASPLGPP